MIKDIKYNYINCRKNDGYDKVYVLKMRNNNKYSEMVFYKEKSLLKFVRNILKIWNERGFFFKKDNEFVTPNGELLLQKGYDKKNVYQTDESVYSQMLYLYINVHRTIDPILDNDYYIGNKNKH